MGENAIRNSLIHIVNLCYWKIIKKKKRKQFDPSYTLSNLLHPVSVGNHSPGFSEIPEAATQNDPPRWSWLNRNHCDWQGFFLRPNSWDGELSHRNTYMLTRGHLKIQMTKRTRWNISCLGVGHKNISDTSELQSDHFRPKGNRSVWTGVSSEPTRALGCHPLHLSDPLRPGSMSAAALLSPTTKSGSLQCPQSTSSLSSDGAVA